MQRMVMLVTISKRSNSENILSFLNTHEVPMTLGRYGRGTATDEMLDYLGIGEKEKCITFSTMQENIAISVLKELEKRKKMSAIGEGIAFTLPISSVAGKISLEKIGGNFIEDIKRSESMLKNKNELIIIIANRGYVDMVMEAARKGGAEGGTVVHARGTGLEQADKFFGANIGAEKEMIFIVSTIDKKADIMKTVIEEAGINTPAASIAFSIPVLDVVGLK